jgi:hypothetical protein
MTESQNVSLSTIGINYGLQDTPVTELSHQLISNQPRKGYSIVIAPISIWVDEWILTHCSRSGGT